MSMTDIVSALERTGPTELALIIFLGTFFVVVGRLLMPSQQRRVQRAAMLPLEEAPVAGTPGQKGASHVKA
jgi:hypothetical protein